MTIRIEQQEPLKISLDNGGTVSVRAISGTGPAGPEGPDGPAGAPGGSDASFAAWILDPDSDTRAAGASVFGPGEFRPEDYGGFAEAAAAAEAYGPRSVVVLANDTYDITGGFELADMSFTIRGQGAGIVDGVAHGSVLRCVSQTGPVLDLSGYKWPENFIGWAAFEGFMVEGDGTAGIAKSGIQNTGALDGIFSAAFRDITIRQTGGPGFAPSQMYLSEVTNLVVETPVSCQANSVPYILAEACNGNVWTNVGVRNPSGTTDDCWSGGAFRVVDNGTYAPTNDHFIDCWAEFLHVPTNGALFHLEGNTCQVQDFQNYDCVPEVAATGTAVVRLDAPGVSNYGGNQVTGLIYGAEAGTMLHYGVELKQPNNSVRGVKGYDGNNVHLTAGVGHSIVVLEGRVSSATSNAFDDDSGEVTNVLIDLNDGWPDVTLPARLSALAISNTVLDIDAIAETGWAYFDAPITGTGLPYAVILTIAGDTPYISQFAFDSAASVIWMRTKTAGTWGSWSLLTTPAASETVAGRVELATQAETNTGTDDVRAVTPLKFQTRLAAFAQPLDSDLTAIAALTTTSYGRALLELANQAALLTAVGTTSETAQGVVELATQAETNTGTDDARAVTPLKFQTRLAAFAQPLDSDLTAIAALSTTSYGRAVLALADQAALMALLSASTTSASGIVELATSAETTTGTDTVRATTPAGVKAVSDLLQPLDADLTAIAALTTTSYGRAFLALANTAALMALLSASSETASGIVELATQAETNTGTDDVRAVTPLKFQTRLAAYAQPLDTDLTAIAALTSAADKVAYSTGAGTWALTDLTATGRSIVDDTSVTAVRATIGAAATTLGGFETKAAASATTGSTTLDCAAASVFSVTPTGNITAVSLTNVPASGTACTISFIVNQGATPRTIATPTGGVFLGAATPTQVANKTCVFTYMTVDGGTTWYCSAAVQV